VKNPLCGVGRGERKIYPPKGGQWDWGFFSKRGEWLFGGGTRPGGERGVGGGGVGDTSQKNYPTHGDERGFVLKFQLR